MKNRTHGLTEREMELAKLLMADCKTTGDIQAKLKRLFAGNDNLMVERFLSFIICRMLVFTQFEG